MGEFIPAQKTKVFRVKVDFDKGRAFEDQCENDKTNVNAKLKGLIDFSLKGQKRYFLAGKNILSYDKVNNSFNWSVQLDSEKEVEILNNLSDHFLENIKQEIDHVLQERNDWVHQKNPHSVEIPKELIGGEENEI